MSGEIEFESISQAATALRDMQRNWALYPHRLHRRASLIQDKLPHVSAKPLVFPSPLPKAPLGSWMLLDANRLLASPHCSSAFANGVVEFVENKSAPPNRAYLKLWEALTLAGRWPQPGELCLDLGASPGGWSWVLQALGARVIAIDRAPLDPEIAALPGIDYRAESAFALEPQAVGPVDWLCSDIVCYPAQAAGAGHALAGVRAGAELRLHHQVPGRDRSRRCRGLCRHTRQPPDASAPQQA